MSVRAAHLAPISTSVRAVLLAAAFTLAALFAIPGTASAAIGVSSFSVTPSTTASAGNPNLAVTSTRSGSSSDQLRRAALKLPAGLSYSVAGATKCSTSNFNRDRCSSSSIVGGSTLDGTLSLFGFPLFSGQAGGTLYALSNSQVGATYRISGVSNINVVGTISGSTASGQTITFADYPQAIYLFGFIPVGLTATGVDLSLQAKAGAANNGMAIITNPATCGPATSTMTYVAHNGTSGTKSSAFNVTGCGPADTTPPVVTITAPADGSTTTQASAQVSFTATDDSGAAPSCDRVSGSSASLSLGANAITVNCTDAAGNAGSASVTVTRVSPPDTMAPVVTITSPVDGSTVNTSSVTLTFTATDDSGVAPTCDAANNSSIGLGEGTNTITVSCTDAAGNSGSDSASVTYIVPDTTPPAIFAVAPADGTSTTASSLVLTYTATDDSGVAPSCSPASGSTVDLALGSNPVAISCTDAAGNVGGANVTYTRTAVPDTENPVVAITSPTDGAVVNAASVIVEFTASDNVGVASCNIDSGDSVALDEGANTITVTCTDAAGNSGSDSIDVTYVVLDTTPPVVSISSPVDGSTQSTDSVTLTFTASDDSGDAPSCDATSGSTVSLLAGPNTVTVTCTDAAGNVGSDSATVTYEVPDTTPPVVVITSPANGSTVGSNSVIVTYTASDDSGAAPSCSRANNSSVALVEGVNTITVSCADAAGNAASASVSVTYVAPDVGDPVVEITSPTDGSTVATDSVTLTYTASDDSGVAPTCTPANNSAVALDPGPNTITVECSDAAGNVGSDSVTVTYDAPDTTPPVVTIISPTNGSTVSTSTVLLTYTAIDNSGVAPGCLPANNSTRNLNPGPNLITVACTDAAGNTGSASVTVTYDEPDTTAPQISEISPANGHTTTAGSVVLTYTASDDSGETPICEPASGSTVTLALGNNPVAITCTDSSGNVGSANVTYTRTDGQDPVVSITSPEDGAVVNTASVAVDFTSSDNVGVASCSIDSGDSVALDEGANTITVTCTDAAGNTGSDSVTVTYVVPDTTGPVISGISPANGHSTTAASVVLTYTATDDSGETPVCSPTSGNSVNLAMGSNPVVISCSDSAGNESVANVTYTRTDGENPVVSITSPADGAIVETASVAVEFSATDNVGVASCNIGSGDSVALDEGANTITVTCTDAAGNSGSDSIEVTYELPAVAPQTTLGDALPALPTLTPAIPVTSVDGTGYQCSINNSAWAGCDPNAGTYGGAFSNNATNKVQVRAINGSTPDATPVTTYIWTSSDAAPSASSTVTPSTTQAAAHPSMTANITLNGGWNPKSVTVDMPAGLNAGLTAVSQKCAFNANPNAMNCAASAPGAYIGTLSGTGVSTSAGYLADATGSLYMTTSPSANSPAGVWLDMASPSHPELGRIRATGEAMIVQENDGTEQGVTFQRLVVNNIPQRSDNGSRFHVNTVTLNLLGDPPGGTFPLLSNPTTCPSTPLEFKGVGTTYGTDGLDTSSGPAVPQLTVPYPVTGCNSLPFAPQISQEFTAWDPIDGSAADTFNPVTQNIGTTLFSNDWENFTRLAEFGTIATMSVPLGNKGVKDVLSYQPAGMGANLPAFGSNAQKCTGSGVGALMIWPGTCPANGAAEVGYMTITTPLLDQPLVGRVKAISKNPIPWMGIEVSHNSTWGINNPVGVTLRLLGVTDLEDPPNCQAAAAPHCTSAGHVKISFADMPDVPFTNVVLDISGTQARPVGSLSPLILTGADQGDPDCKPNDAAVTSFTPQGATQGGPEDVVRTQLTQMTTCV